MKNAVSDEEANGFLHQPWDDPYEGQDILEFLTERIRECTITATDRVLFAGYPFEYFVEDKDAVSPDDTSLQLQDGTDLIDFGMSFHVESSLPEIILAHRHNPDFLSPAEADLEIPNGRFASVILTEGNGQEHLDRCNYEFGRSLFDPEFLPTTVNTSTGINSTRAFGSTLDSKNAQQQGILIGL